MPLMSAEMELILQRKRPVRSARDLEAGSAQQSDRLPQTRHHSARYGALWRRAYLAKRGFIGRIHAGEEVSFQMQGEAESDGVERLG